MSCLQTKYWSSSSPKSTLRRKRLDFSRTAEPWCFSFDNRLKTLRLVEMEKESPNLRCRQESLATQPRCFSFDNRLKEPGSATQQFNQGDSTLIHVFAVASHLLINVQPSRTEYLHQMTQCSTVIPNHCV